MNLHKVDVECRKLAATYGAAKSFNLYRY